MCETSEFVVAARVQVIKKYDNGSDESLIKKGQDLDIFEVDKDTKVGPIKMSIYV